MTSCHEPAGISLDPDTLLDVRRALLGHELVLDGLRARAPDTGPTSGLTARAFDRVAASVDAIAADLHGLAEALGQYVDDLGDQDGQVTAMFDLLRVRGLS